MTSALFTRAADLASAVLFVVALWALRDPVTARRGVMVAEVGMTLAIVTTLVRHDIVSYQWILVGLLFGSAIGVAMAVLVPVTYLPQRTALTQTLGALAAALIGTAHYSLRCLTLDTLTMTVLSLQVTLGFSTVTASLMAFAKLQGLVPSRPLVYRGQNVVTLSVLAAAVLVAGYLVVNPARAGLFLIVAGLSLLFGVLLVGRIGAADMPTVISLLNAFAGLSTAVMGLVLDNDLLIVAGALDGASGLILSVIMCRAMNRSFSNVLFGAFGRDRPTTGRRESRAVRRATVAEAAAMLGTARSAIIVPGHGMAVARAQREVRVLFEALTARGTDVRFAIHPVAGRMPGHMNVLLAAADIPYDTLIDVEAINPSFAKADVVVVIGANDVTNPAARDDRASPIYRMPILDVDRARTVMVIKRTMSPGFAGIDNELYHMERTMMLFGDAKSVVGELVELLRAPAGAALNAERAG